MDVTYEICLIRVYLSFNPVNMIHTRDGTHVTLTDDLFVEAHSDREGGNEESDLNSIACLLACVIYVLVLWTLDPQVCTYVLVLEPLHVVSSAE